MLVAAAVLTAVGIFSITSSWTMHVDEKEALVAAQQAVGLPGRARLGPAGVARAAQPAHVARDGATRPRIRRPGEGSYSSTPSTERVVEHLSEDNPDLAPESR